jgi:hypothetical protein
MSLKRSMNIGAPQKQGVAAFRVEVRPRYAATTTHLPECDTTTKRCSTFATGGKPALESTQTFWKCLLSMILLRYFLSPEKSFIQAEGLP